jgi:HTH-type transcriptional regulator/antitoxin MqsA
MTTIDTVICPNCEEGSLRLATYADTFKNGTSTIEGAGLECYVCSHCDARPQFEQQIRSNHLRVADAKRRAAGLLEGAAIRAIREQLALSQHDAAELFGGGANAFSKYERGEVVQSDSMDRLLRIVAMYPLLAEELRLLSAMPKAKPVVAAHGYGSGKSVTLDDPNYRSRVLRELPVVVEIQGYSKRKVA